jgi:lysophospholipase L1-like esterase
MRLANRNLPKTHVYFIAIKPSIARQKLWPKMREANALVAKLADESDTLTYIDIATPMFAGQETPAKSLFRDDGLHLSETGYAIWNKALSPTIQALARRE